MLKDFLIKKTIDSFSTLDAITNLIRPYYKAWVPFWEKIKYKSNLTRRQISEKSFEEGFKCGMEKGEFPEPEVKWVKREYEKNKNT